MARKYKKISASILVIGNEILSGRTKDTNTSTLATWLNSLGIKFKYSKTLRPSNAAPVTT